MRLQSYLKVVRGGEGAKNAVGIIDKGQVMIGLLAELSDKRGIAGLEALAKIFELGSGDLASRQR